MADIYIHPTAEVSPLAKIQEGTKFGTLHMSGRIQRLERIA